MADPDRGLETDFEQFVAYRSAALLRTAYLLCGGNRAEAEDLPQDVLERVYPRWRRISGQPEAYVRTALANTAANRGRRRARRVHEVPLTDAAEPAATTAPEPDQLVADQDLVVRALAELPPRMRAVLVLRYFEDLSEHDIATTLRCSAGTVKSQAARGLTRLRALIGTGQPDYAPEPADPDSPAPDADRVTGPGPRQPRDHTGVPDGHH